MALTCVKMCEEVWLTCMTHSLSTESEEIMGLLLGDIIFSSEDGSVTALIWGACPQQRSDRKKDRVETNPEQVAAATIEAEKMTKAIGRTTRVIGWYHSHPHITVLPSHVDVRTQGMYQMLDSGFIGLIFSCFSEDMHKVGRVQVIAFQSLDGKKSQMLKAVPVSPASKGALIDLELSVSTSINASVRSGAAGYDEFELDTADSRATAASSKAGGKSADLGGFFASVDKRKEKSGGSYQSVPFDNATIDIDSMDTSDGIQEALLLSNQEVSAAEYVRKEIPLNIVPSSSVLELHSPFASYFDLQQVIIEEEQAAYNQAILQSTRDGKVHPLTFIHQTSTYQASMCKLIEYCLSPALVALQDRIKANERKYNALVDEAERLDSEVAKSISPRGKQTTSKQKDLYDPLDVPDLRTRSGRSRRG